MKSKTVLYVLGILFLLTACSSTKEKDFTINDIKYTGLHVQGNSLLTSDGTPFVMRGINHAHAWYKDYDEIALDAIEETGANTVRIVLATGKRWDKDNKDSLRNIIEECHKRNMVCVVEVHDATGSDSIDELLDMANYWKEMADVLIGTEEYCIVNIANEWCGSWNAKKWKDGYTKAIKIVRDSDIKNCLMIDSAGWGQFGFSAIKYGKEVFNADSIRNTMFSVHMYGMSGRWEWLIRYNLKGVTRQNLCVCVGEFGWTHSDGDVKEDYLMEYCQNQNIGYLAWSWKGNSGGVEYLDLAEEWDGSKLSDWGEIYNAEPESFKMVDKEDEIEIFLSGLSAEQSEAFGRGFRYDIERLNRFLASNGVCLESEPVETVIGDRTYRTSYDIPLSQKIDIYIYLSNK